MRFLPGIPVTAHSCVSFSCLSESPFFILTIQSNRFHFDIFTHIYENVLMVYLSFHLKSLALPSYHLPLILSIYTDEDASGSGGGQQYADDWKAGAVPVVPPARPPRPPRPPRRDGLGVRGGSGSARYNQGRSRNLGSSVGLHTPLVLLLLPSALTLLVLR